MSSEDQLTEIEALESIFGSQFTHHYNKRAVKVTLQPFIQEDEVSINHVQCDVWVIFGEEYPIKPLHSIFVSAIGMDEQKVNRFQTYIEEKLCSIMGDNHCTKLCVIAPTKLSKEDRLYKNEFFTNLADDTYQFYNVDGIYSTASGDVILFELFESIREWLVNNNVREAKSLRDTVNNIDSIDEAERLRAENLLIEEVDEPEPYCDPYDEQDNVFVQEYDSGIECDPNQICTSEVFEAWSVQFLKAQNERRLILLAEQGKLDDSTRLTGKQLFIQNLVSDLLLNEQGGGSAYTFVKPKMDIIDDNNDDNNNDDNNNNNLLYDEGNDNTPIGGDIDIDLDALDIDESLFDMSDDDDDITTTPTPTTNTNATNTTTTPTATTTTTTTTEPTSPTPTATTTTTTTKDDKKSTTSKDKKSEKKDDKKDDKKDKKSSTKDKKNDKKPKGGFGHIEGGFSDFLDGF